MSRAVTQAELDQWEPMVRGIARRLTPDPEDRADLEQEGRAALLTFIPRLDKRRGKPITYLYACVRGEMQKWLSSQARTIRIPRGKAESGHEGIPVESLDAYPDTDSLPILAQDGLADRVATLIDAAAVIRAAKLMPFERSGLAAVAFSPSPTHTQRQGGYLARRKLERVLAERGE